MQRKLLFVAALLQAVIAVGLVGSANAVGVLYGARSSFHGQGTEIAQWVESIDPATGDASKIAQTFLFAGDAIDDNGIATFDPVTSTFFYTGNFPSSMIFRVNTKTGQLLPPWYYTGAESVGAMVFDATRQRLLILAVGQNSAGKTIGLVVAIPTVGPVTTIMQVPDTIQVDGIIDLAINNDVLYVAFRTSGTPKDVFNFQVAALDLLQPNMPTLIQKQLICPGYANKVVPDSFGWDTKTNTLIGVAEIAQPPNVTLTQYAMITIQANIKSPATFGACSLTMLQLGNLPAAISAGAYNHIDRIYYFNVLAGSNQLMGFDVATSKVTSTVDLDILPINLVYSPTN